MQGMKFYEKGQIFLPFYKLALSTLCTCLGDFFSISLVFTPSPDVFLIAFYYFHLHALFDV